MRRIITLFAVLFVASSVAAQVRTDPLPPEEVFLFHADNDGHTVRAVFEISDDYYLYEDRFILTTDTPGFEVFNLPLPQSEEFDDPLFGTVGIYYHGVTLHAQVEGDGEFELKVITQGCDKLLGICYPPQTHVALLDTEGGGASISGVPDTANTFGGAENVDGDAATATAIIVERSLWGVMVAFFGFGLLLSFTPCVLPMVPILLAVTAGEGGRNRKLSRVAAYIAGVTVTYTALGVIAGLSGRLLAPFLQQPPVLWGTAVIFIGLSLSMFGWYELRPPAFMRKQLGSGAFMMGALSAAVVSPCVAAPLVGALAYIGTTGDALTGGAALFSLSLGMSVLLAVAGIGGKHLLPRAGEWMNDINQLLGILLLGAAVWVVSSLLPEAVGLFLYGALAIFAGVILYSGVRAAKAAAVVALLWGAAMIVGAAGGGRDPLAPLSHFADRNGSVQQESLVFVPTNSPQTLSQALSGSTRPVMLEFYADWCVSCKEMERWTFTDARVHERLKQMTLLRADVTSNDEDASALLEQFNLYGPPAMLFFKPGGRPLPLQVHGYQSADEFLQTLERVFGSADSI